MKITLQLSVKPKSPKNLVFQWFRAHFNLFCCKTQDNILNDYLFYHKTGTLKITILILIPDSLLQVFLKIVADFLQHNAH